MRFNSFFYVIIKLFYNKLCKQLLICWTFWHWSGLVAKNMTFEMPSKRGFTMKINSYLYYPVQELQYDISKNYT